MQSSVRQKLERKNLKRRKRLRNIAENANYEEFLMEPESSKSFGFPDNSTLIDPDTSLLHQGSKSIS